MWYYSPTEELRLDAPSLAKIHRVAFEYSCAGWDGLCDHLRNVPLLHLLLVNFVSGSKLELMFMFLVLNTRSSLIHLHGFHLLLQP